ncbi:MAG TPA: outer membrane beta-barrel protein [Bacteroidales bacterium]|nr:outer membrane beta-barrel protein [Bacteroidales bacterium]
MKYACKLFLLFILLVSGSAYAQIPARVTIKGVIKDNNNNEAGFATVMLLNPKDSTLQNFTQSDVHGAFGFNNVKNTAYLLKVSHISFLPLQQMVEPAGTSLNDLGIVSIKPIAKELFEVVIREAKAPLTIRGDTIEYDATTFKAPPGSTVEDLLRRLPGIEVDVAGNLKSQGKDVKRVYVDGKTFFGDDPSGATKNLDANAVSKVQVFDEKSEQSKLTGIDDGVKEKAMNLELKGEYKKGSFGKATVAGGANEEGVLRWAGRANYNRFDKKSQLSFIAYGNNINETGVNWEDYSEFKGQSTFDQYDNGDFGFSSGRGRYYYMADDESPMSYFDGRGFTENYGGGANYNFDNTKTKFNISYFYKNNRLKYDQFDYKETFVDDSSFFNNDTTAYSDNRQSHTIAARIEQNLDSNNVIIVKANFRFNDIHKTDIERDYFSLSGGSLINDLYTGNTNANNAWRLTSAAIYRHKFKVRGRSFAVSAGYNRNPGDDNENLFSLNNHVIPSYAEVLHRKSARYYDKQQIKSSLLYTEPLSKKFFMEVFYNFNTSDNKVNRQITDLLNSDVRIDSLSVYYTNKVMINRLGTAFRYSFNGLNMMLGAAGQYLVMNGEYAVDEGMPLLANPIDKTYWSLSPKFNVTCEFPNHMWLEFDYGYDVSEPSFDYLQPVPDVSNPLYRVEGNINLKPERTHNVSANYNYYNPASFSHAGVYSNYSYCANNITYNQNMTWVDSLGIMTVSVPDNNSESHHVSTWVWLGYPIIKTKFTNDWNFGYSYNKSGSYINNVFNKNNSNSYQLRTSFNITPGQRLVMTVSGDASISDVKFSMNNERNQIAQEYNAGLSVKWQFAAKTYFEGNFDYEFYRNSQYDFDKNIPVLNASVRQLIGKKNHFEIRLAAFDIFNQRQYIRQYASQNYFVRSVAGTLARYFMLSVSYNIRGYETKLKKDRHFW